MQTTLAFCEDVKRVLNITSDYALAKALGVTRSTISHYRSGRSVFDDQTAIRVAEILEIDPFEVIASTNAERARDDKTRHVWIHALEIFSKGFRWLALPANACGTMVPQV